MAINKNVKYSQEEVIRSVFDEGANVLNVSTTGGTASRITVIQNEEDYTRTFTYLDAGTDDERVDTITYSSVTAGAPSVRDTYAYAGIAGAYRISTITRSLV